MHQHLRLLTLVPPLLLGSCALDTQHATDTEPLGISTSALTVGAGSLGSCTGNPAVCAAGSVAAGSSHTLAVRTDGTVWGWGRNNYGQIGDGTVLNRIKPVKLPGLTGVVSVTAGNAHSAALKSNGTVWAWGINARGQLGDGTTTERHSPVQVQGLSGVVSVDAGGSHNVALKSDGTVWTWGYNASGQLGTGTTSDSYAPVQVPGLPSMTAVSTGGDFTLALASDGTVWAWGENSYGQVGTGAATQHTPAQVFWGGFGGVTAIAAGFGHAIALKADGTVWSWGHGYSGQLGTNTSGDTYQPNQVWNVSTAFAIAASSDTSFALDTTTTWAWGHNIFGALGLGDTSDRATPSISSSAGYVAIAGGGLHTVAVAANGAVWANAITEPAIARKILDHLGWRAVPVRRRVHDPADDEFGRVGASSAAE